jgi:hypothetical protein
MRFVCEGALLQLIEKERGLYAKAICPKKDTNIFLLWLGVYCTVHLYSGVQGGTLCISTDTRVCFSGRAIWGGKYIPGIE